MHLIVRCFLLCSSRNHCKYLSWQNDIPSKFSFSLHPAGLRIRVVFSVVFSISSSFLCSATWSVSLNWIATLGFAFNLNIITRARIHKENDKWADRNRRKTTRKREMQIIFCSEQQNREKSLNLTILFEVYLLIFDGNAENEENKNQKRKNSFQCERLGINSVEFLLEARWDAKNE